MDRRNLAQIALSAVIFYVVFRFLSFLGLGVVLGLVVIIGAWYLLKRRPEVPTAWKRRITLKRPRRRRASRVHADDRVPLSPQERTVFDDMVREEEFRRDHVRVRVIGQANSDRDQSTLVVLGDLLHDEQSVAAPVGRAERLSEHQSQPLIDRPRRGIGQRPGHQALRSG